MEYAPTHYQTPNMNLLSNMNPLVSAILTQLGANPQVIVEALLPIVKPSLDKLIEEKLNQYQPRSEAEVKSGADLLLEFTDTLIPIELQNKIIADPARLKVLRTAYKVEIDAMADRLTKMWAIS